MIVLRVICLNGLELAFVWSTICNMKKVLAEAVVWVSHHVNDRLKEANILQNSIYEESATLESGGKFQRVLPKYFTRILLFQPDTRDVSSTNLPRRVLLLPWVDKWVIRWTWERFSRSRCFENGRPEYRIQGRSRALWILIQGRTWRKLVAESSAN